MRLEDIPFMKLSSFCLTSFGKNTKVGLNHAAAVSNAGKMSVFAPYDFFI
jgi:hypothetical protein